MANVTVEEMWDSLVEQGIATADELQLVSNGWGYNTENMETVLYVRTGNRSFDQLEDEQSEDDDE